MYVHVCAVGLKSDGTTGHLEIDAPRATVLSLSMCDGHTTGHWPWRCSSDGTDEETRFIARRYVVLHHFFDLKLRFGHQ